MRICVVSSSVLPCPPPGYSGLEQVAWQTAKGLAEKGHETFLVAPQGSSCPGVNMVHCGPPGQWDERKSYSEYWKMLLQMDVIIDNSWQKNSYLLRMEGRLKAPVLGVMHAPVNTMYQSWPPAAPGLGSVGRACPVCISQDQANHFQGLFGTEVRVCYNGVDSSVYKSIGIPRTNRLLFLGRFSTIKGPDIALEVCKQTGKELDLIGDITITNEPEYFEACRKACDGKQLKIIGPCSRGECVWWYSQAHYMLHMNMRFREPFGLAPVEAMMCGCPVIAFNNGAMRETIKHGETGFLVSSPEEVVELVKADAVKTINRERCREWAVDNFSVQRMVDRYEALCTEAIQKGW